MSAPVEYLSRGDWMGVTLLLVVFILMLWRKDSSSRELIKSHQELVKETKESINSNTAALDRSSQVTETFCETLEGLAKEIHRTTDQNAEIAQKTLTALLEAIRDRKR